MLERFMWIPYPKSKPKKSGDYLCIIKYGNHRFNRCVMLLYYDHKKDIWKDCKRKGTKGKKREEHSNCNHRQKYALFYT